MPLSHFSRTIVFILTFPSTERLQMVKSKEILQEMNPESTNIYIDGLIDHYKSRPDSMESMCLIIFAAWFDFISNAQHDKIINKKHFGKSKIGKIIANRVKNYLQENRDDDDYGEILNERFLNGEPQLIGEFFELRDKKGWIQRRERCKLVRYRNYDKDKATERRHFLREQMMLYYPFRREGEIENHNNLEDIYGERMEKIAENKHEFNGFYGYGSIDDLELELEKIAEEFDDIREDRLEEECEDYLNAQAILEAEDDELDASQLAMREELEAEYGHFARLEPDMVRVDRIDEEDSDKLTTNEMTKKMPNKLYYNSLASLNLTQQRYIMTVVKKLSNNEKFYHLMIGPGGCGKSYVIKLINQAIMRHIDTKLALQNNITPAECLNPPTFVLMSSFLGKVAFRMRGQTIHSAFSIRVCDFTDSGNYEKLRKKFGVNLETNSCALQLIIFDEVSLIDKKLFQLIDKKLRGMLNKPKEQFGGIPMILSGDFNQNRPISGGFIFEKDDSGYKALINNDRNELWEQFELIELSEIMRQRDDKEFSEALTYFGNTGFIDLPQRYLDVFNSCIRPFDSIPKDAVFLFATNNARKEMNDTRIVEPYFEQFAYDKVIGAKDEKDAKFKHNKYIHSLEELDDEKKHYMPNMIKIQLNIKYMLLYNDDVPDGIANGTVGILRNYTMHKKQKDQIDTLFFDFLEDDVGFNRRTSFMITGHVLNRLILPMTTAELKKLTPIKRATAKINIAPTRYDWVFQRTQFQLVPCEAMTISKIQGDTCEVVAFDISQTMAHMRSNYYVAMSRVTKKNNLYLYGADCLIGNKRVGAGYGVGESRLIKSLTTREAKKARKHYLENSVVQIEMARMRREKKVSLEFENIFQKKTDTSVSIMFYNVDGDLKNKFHVLKKDFGINTCDIVIFTNCSYDPLNDTNQYLFDEYSLIKSSGVKDNTKCGHFMYCRSKRVYPIGLEVLKTNDDRGSNVDLELTLFKFYFQNSWLFICFVQNNSCKDIKDFYNYVKTFLKHSVQENCMTEIELTNQTTLMFTCNYAFKFSDKEVTYLNNKLKAKWKLLNYLI